MQALELLKEYKKKVAPSLEKYFQKKIRQAEKIDDLAAEATKMIADFTLADGKRIRPAIVYYAFLASGGKDGPEIVDASTGIELIHTFLLIHDDIIDKDEKRHGVETLHERYRKIAQKIAPQKDASHFGNSMAMIAGDMAASMANEIIFNAKFPAETIIQALDKLQEIVYVTIPGEMLDVVLEFRGLATEEEILRMHEGKTSRYTFEGPLQLGGILAGADEKLQQQFSAYALPLGKAFQIRDDILGIFGDEKKLGKPVGSDIIEAKQTLLVIKALEYGNDQQRQAIKNLLGKQDLSLDEINQFRNIIQETGSLEYSQKLAERLIAESLAVLEQIDFKNQEAKIFFEGIAKYIIEREK